VIPRRKDQRPDDKRVRFDKDAYKRRSVVEQCMGWLKQCRAVATRLDKLAVNYLATVKMALIQRYLRKLAPENPPSDRA